MKRTNQAVSQALGALIGSYGYSRAGYWIADGSDYSRCADRKEAARAILAGATISLALANPREFNPAEPRVNLEALERFQARMESLGSLRSRIGRFARERVERERKERQRGSIRRKRRATLRAQESDPASVESLPSDPIARKRQRIAQGRELLYSLRSGAEAAQRCARKDAEALDSEAREEARAASAALASEGIDPSADDILRAASFFLCGFRPEHADSLIRFGVAINALADGQRSALPGFVPEDALRFADQWTRKPHPFRSGPELEREALRLLDQWQRERLDSEAQEESRMRSGLIAAGWIESPAGYYHPKDSKRERAPLPLRASYQILEREAARLRAGAREDIRMLREQRSAELER